MPAYAAFQKVAVPFDYATATEDCLNISRGTEGCPHKALVGDGPHGSI